MGVKIIEYKNKKILYVDYREIKTEEESDVIAKETFRIQQEAVQAGNKMYDVLVHQGANPFTKLGAKNLKEAPPEVSSRIAIVGMSGVMKTVSQGVNTYAFVKNVRFFETEDEAKEWLVS